jgi:hypothetical protein
MAPDANEQEKNPQVQMFSEGKDIQFLVMVASGKQERARVVM